MKRRSKVELFERIRRAYEFEKKSIRAIARQYGVHRRMVRQAIANAIPPDRKTPQRSQPQMDEVKEFIKQILEKDKKEPRKQHHTAHRIFVRIGREMSGIKVSCGLLPKRGDRSPRSASEPDVNLWIHPAPRSSSDCHSYPWSGNL